MDCGHRHCVALTEAGEVYTWGAGFGCGCEESDERARAAVQLGGRAAGRLRCLVPCCTTPSVAHDGCIEHDGWTAPWPTPLPSSHTRKARCHVSETAPSICPRHTYFAQADPALMEELSDKGALGVSAGRGACRWRRLLPLTHATALCSPQISKLGSSTRWICHGAKSSTDHHANSRALRSPKQLPRLILTDACFCCASQSTLWCARRRGCCTLGAGTTGVRLASAVSWMRS